MVPYKSFHSLVHEQKSCQYRLRTRMIVASSNATFSINRYVCYLYILLATRLGFVRIEKLFPGNEIFSLCYFTVFLLWSLLCMCKKSFMFVSFFLKIIFCAIFQEIQIIPIQICPVILRLAHRELPFITTVISKWLNKMEPRNPNND